MAVERDPAADETARLLMSERVASTRIAMWGRIAVIFVMALWIGLTRQPPLVY
jgi:hypothetical protein